MTNYVKNKYTCESCKGTIITIDLDVGTTPSMLACRARGDCKGVMWSSFYSPSSVGDAEPTHEWYIPVREERRSGNKAYRDYYKKGGLALRERDNVGKPEEATKK